VIDFQTDWANNGLVVNKVQRVFQRDLSRYESQVKALESLVRPLKGEYLEKLLGDSAYRKLVMLEDIRPAADDLRRKRPAEEEVDHDRKRTKVTA